jgi:hypothetical protein
MDVEWGGVSHYGNIEMPAVACMNRPRSTPPPNHGSDGCVDGRCKVP